MGYLPGFDEWVKDPQNLRLVFFILAVLVLVLGWLHWDFVSAINSVLLLFILYYLMGWSKSPKEVRPGEKPVEEIPAEENS